MVACDRNQAVKRKEDEQYIIQGIDFSRHTRRLDRIYRCPFPVYVAAVGLLFRWFANQNIAVTIHTNQDLSSCFGFKTIPRQENHMMTTFSMRNDCHPGNNWQQTVSYFNRPERAYDYISQFAVKNDDVLWACFKKTSKQFNYAQLQQQYTWVDLTSEQAEDEIDKHIKGQEFRIVFVEGLPPNMNPPDMAQNTHADLKQNESERKMWQARKNLYIVCSRASAFLYFVSSIDSRRNTDISMMELKELIRQVSRPVQNEHESGKTWTFTIKMPAISRYPIQFRDLKEPVVGHPINKFPEVEKPEKTPIRKIIRYQTKSSNHLSFKNSHSPVNITNIPFESHLKIRLRHIYGVLHFMKQDLDFPSATQQALKLFPKVRDYQTISDKCTRRFAGNVGTFISWFRSGQMLNKLHVKFSLSDHDYEIFKKLLS